MFQITPQKHSVGKRYSTWIKIGSENTDFINDHTVSWNLR